MSLSGKRTLGVLLAAPLILLVALEVALRVSGALHAQPEGPPAEVVAFAQGRRVILCMGDSVTYGIGASGGMSYPDQLQRLLDQGAPDAGWLVVNGGMTGMNSRMIRGQLDRYLGALHPEIVTLLFGFTNSINRYGYNDWRAESGHAVTAWGRLGDHLHQVRVLRFFRYLGALRDKREVARRETVLDGMGAVIRSARRWYGSRAGGAWLQEGTELLMMGRFHDAEGRFQACLRAAPTDAACLWGRGLSQQGRREGQLARQSWGACIELDPSDPVCLSSLGEQLLQDEAPLHPEALDAARGWFQRATLAAPGFSGGWWGLAMVATRQGELGAAEQAVEGCLAADPDDHRCYPALLAWAWQAHRVDAAKAILAPLADEHPLAADYLASLEGSQDPQAMVAWAASDLARAVDAAQEAGAAVVLQTYPVPDPVSSEARALAASRGLPLADHAAAFEQIAPSREARRALLWVDEMHPNDDGYGIMARTLLRSLREHSLVDLDASRQP